MLGQSPEPTTYVSGDSKALIFEGQISSKGRFRKKGGFGECTLLRWHVCRVNFARKIFFEPRIFLRKNAPKFSPKFLSLCSVGQKKSPENSLQISHQIFQISLRKIKKKFTDELLQERRENTLALVFLFSTGEHPNAPLISFFGTGEHPNVPSFLFLVLGNIRQKLPFWKPPFCEPPIATHALKIVFKLLLIEIPFAEKSLHTYHWHRNQSEAKQYDFRINYLQITKAKAKVKFGAKYLCGHKCERSSIQLISIRKRKRKNIVRELISL